MFCGAFKMADIGRLQRRDSADLIAVGAECNCCAASPSIGHPTRNGPNCRAEMIHETSSLIHSRRKPSDDIKVRGWWNVYVGGAHVGGNLSRDSRRL